MSKKPESNQEVMEMLFPEWKEYSLNSLTPVVVEYNNSEHPIVMSMLFIGDDEKAQAFRSEPEEGNTEIDTALYIEESKTCNELVIQFEFICLEGNPTMKTVIDGNNALGQAGFIKTLCSINNFFLFIADKHGKLIKVKQVEWNHEEYNEVLSQFDFRSRLN